VAYSSGAIEGPNASLHVTIPGRMHETRDWSSPPWHDMMVLCASSAAVALRVILAAVISHAQQGMRKAQELAQDRTGQATEQCTCCEERDDSSLLSRMVVR